MSYFTTKLTQTTSSVEETLSIEDVKDMYIARFPAYTAFSFISISLNIFSLIAILKIKGSRSIYHVFLANLAFCDIVGGFLIWFYNNHLVIAPYTKAPKLSNGTQPRLRVDDFPYGHNASLNMSANDTYVMDVTNKEEYKKMQIKELVSKLLLLSSILLATMSNVASLFLLAFNQYLAIFHSFFARIKLVASKGCFFVLVTWLVTGTLSILPSICIFVTAAIQNDYNVSSYVILSPFEIIACLQAILVIVVIVFYLRIYQKVLKCKRNTTLLRGTLNSRNMSEKALNQSESTHKKTKRLNKHASNRIYKSNCTDVEKSKDNYSNSSDGKTVRFLSCLKKSKFARKSRETQNIDIEEPWTADMSSSASSFKSNAINRLKLKVNIKSSDHNYKAFLTTMVLTGALIFCWLPYFVISFMLRHQFSDRVLWFLSHFKFYLVEFLPIISYILDPILFGLRIRSVRKSYVNIMCSFKC